MKKSNQTNKKNIEDIIALTPMQEGMLFHYLKEPGSLQYFEQLYLDISGDIDHRRFEHAWHVVINTNEMLRTAFRWKNAAKPVQVILKTHPLKVRYYDFSNRDNSEKKKVVHRIIKRDAQEKFDLSDVPFRIMLCKMEEAKYKVVISSHHILYDGWSSGIILKEFFKAYHHLTKGTKIKAPPVKTKFKEYVRWMQTLQIQDAQKQKEFWQDYLKGFDEQIELSIKRKNQQKQKGVFHHTLRFSKGITEELEYLVKSSNITSAALLYSAWGILLQRYNNCDDVLFGTTVSGRTAKIKGIEDMVGLFINTVPLRIQSHANEKTVDLLYRIDNSLQKRQEYEHTALVDIKEYSGMDNQQELFDSVMVIENYPLETGFMPVDNQLSLRVDSYAILEQTHYDLTLTVSIHHEIEVTFSCKKELFDRDCIVRLSNYFRCITKNIIRNPGKEVSDIEIISGEEKNQILYEFNNTGADYQKDKTIHQLFEEQVERAPDNIAIFNHQSHEKISYIELNEKSNRLARILREKGVRPDHIVGLMMSHSFELVVSIWAVLKAGGAYLPMETNTPQERFNLILEESETQIVLAAKDESSRFKDLMVIDPGDKSYYIGSGENLEPVSQPRNLAYVIYTSGSTGKPKGVILENRSLVNYVCWAAKNYVKGENLNFPLYTSIAFDLTVTSLFTPLITGNAIIVYGEQEGGSPIEKLEKIIWDERIGVVKLIPTHLKVLKELVMSHRPGRLPEIKRFILGGENLESGLSREIHEIFNGHIEIYNEYGPTEAAVGCMIHLFDPEQDTRPSVPIGAPADNVQIYILDKYQKPVAPGMVGEMYIAGHCLARGYLKHPGLNAEKFVSNPFCTNRMEEKESRMFRTGDLARWLPNAKVEFLGRIDRQVKVRGFRIELAEIENQLLTYENVKEAVAIDKDNREGEKYLCAYLAADTPLKILRLREYLLKKLPEYMIPTYFKQIDRIPLTPSGKINRNALPIPRLTSAKTYVAPRNQREEILVNIWSHVLDINREQIGIDHHFFEIGGHSLKTVHLIGRIYKELNIELTLPEIFNILTIRQLAQYIGKKEKGLFNAIEPVEEKEYYASSSAQQRLFALHQKNPHSLAYNITGVILLEGTPQKDKLEEAFKKLIARHESLKTSIDVIDVKAVQRIHEKVEFAIECYDIGNREEEMPDAYCLKPEFVIKDFIRPFDLSQAPLMRVGLIKENDRKHILVVDMHHIISDGISVSIMIKELMAFYASKEPQDLTVQYKDFTQWQQKQIQSGQISLQESYWLKQFQTGDEIPVLHLPADYSRPFDKSFEGSTITFEITKEDTEALKYLALKTKTTLFMILLAAFNVFISKLSGQEDIILGIPVSGRRYSDLEVIVGMFVNTLALRNYPRVQKTFLEFLEEVGENFLKAMENQDYQFEDLVEKIGAPMDVSRNPLFDVMLVLQNMETETLEIPGLKLTPRPYASEFSKFDITFIAEEKTNSLHFSVSYSTALFKKETIEGFTHCFKKVISVILEAPHRKLSGIEIISAEEKWRILHEFNDTKTGYPADKTLHRLFEEQLEQTPHRIALVGRCQSVSPADGDEGIGVGMRFIASTIMHITYKQLNQKSNQLAYILKEKGVQPDAIVGLMAERSLEMVIGMMGILKAGGAYMPIDTDYPPTRVNYMLSDSGAKFLVSMEGMVSEVNEVSEVIELSSLPWDSPLERGAPKGWGVSKPAASSSNLAYVIYTSGSTGQPKGVMVEHWSAVNVVSWFGRTHNLAPGTHVLQMSDYTFDPSVNQVFGTLHRGALLCLISREVLTDMELLRRHIKKHHIHVLNFVPSVLNELLSSGSQLESVRVVLSGGEKLDNPVKDAILAKGYRLYNQYGPTETTIDALVEKCSMDKVTLGKPIFNVKCYIKDKDNNLAPIGIPGELYVAGTGVARGYLNNPEMTNSKFQIPNSKQIPNYKSQFPNKEAPFGKSMQSCIHASIQYHSPAHYPITPLPHSPIYRTGDLARWLPEGKVQFLGRLDHQVKIGGFRIEVEEIENRLLRLDGITECVVTARETIETIDGSHPGNENQRYLCAYFVSDRDWDTQQLKEYLSEEVPGYMVPQHFVPMELLPLTATGKIDRDALPGPETGKGRITPANQTEETLVKIWAKVLMVKEEDIGMDDNFFQLGGHSLKMTVIASEIHKAFDIKVPMEELFRRLTIAELARYLQRSLKEKYFAIELQEEKEYYPLSSAQKRLYILQRMELKSTVYNMSEVLILEGAIVREKLEEIFREMIRRHESLRTSFEMVADEPVQKIHDKVDFEIEYSKLLIKKEYVHSQQPPDKVANCRLPDADSSFIRPFDLSAAPLLRVGLNKSGEKQYNLIVDIHHIITDGTSTAIFVNEFMSLYSGDELPALSVRYRDFARWQNSNKVKRMLKKQEMYWLKEFAHKTPKLNLPYDFKRPIIQRFEGSAVNFKLDKKQVEELKRFAINEESTLFMVFLAIFTILLWKLSGQEEIIIGSPIAGRRQVELQQVLGMFVNTLAIKNYPSSGKTFNEFFAEVKKYTLSAYENQDYQFEDLVEKVSIERDASRNPLFDVMFAFQNIDSPIVKLPDLTLKQGKNINCTSKFDLNLQAIESRKQLLFTLEYSTKLFRWETIEKFIRYFKRIVSFVVAAPGTKLGAVDVLEKEEREEILRLSRGKEEILSESLTLHRLFEKKVEETRDRIALVFEDQSLSYGELNTKANQMARYLRKKGVDSDRVVGLMMGRSLEMIIAMLAILKAGFVYLPVDAEYPAERKKYMLNDCGVSLLLTNNETIRPGELASVKDSLVVVDTGDAALYIGNGENLARGGNGSDLLYVIYTSGTTGNPKGVMLEHRNLVNLFKHQFNYTTIDFSRVLQFTTISFDVSFQEVFSAMLAGGMLVLIKKSSRENIPVLFRLIERNSIITLFLPTSFLKYIFNDENFLEDIPASIKHIITAGEQLVISTGFKGYLRAKGVHLHNHYGPSETHVVTALTLEPFQDIPEIPSIGRPISNTAIYILDQDLHLQPIGVPGEIHIGGIQVGRGYWGNDQLTRQKFISDPYWEGRRFYKTGDLGKWLPDGNIEFLGRIDYQVKIRGFRVEPGEVESHLRQLDIVKEAVVIPQEKEGGEKYLCAYIVSDHTIIPAEIKTILSKRLPDFMTPDYFMHIDEIPLTPNGKLNRRALPAPEITAGEIYVAPRNKIEKKLAAIWSDVLSLGKEKIGVDDNFFQLGGHSLKATILVSRINKILNVEVSLAEVFNTSTIRGLAEHIRGTAQHQYTAIPPVERKEYYELSSAEKRLFILNEIGDVGIVYNLPAVWMMEGTLDKQRLEDVFAVLIRRHEVLGTSFTLMKGKPVQIIHDQVEFQIQSLSMNTDTWDQQRDDMVTTAVEKFIKPFDLSRAPLLRVALMRLAEEKHLIIFDMHHIITDGVSMGIFIKDFMDLYREVKLPPLRIHYKDFSQWQTRGGYNVILDKQESYWLDRFKDGVPILDFPADYPRPPVQSFKGDCFHFTLNEVLSGKLKQLNQETETTLNMVLLAAYTILLSKYSGQEDVVVGLGIAGRTHPDQENMIGFFVNTIAIRNQPKKNLSFGEFLKQVKKNTLKGYENQGYPFDELVNKLGIPNDLSRNPLFDVAFVVQNMDVGKIEIENLKMIPYAFETNVSRFDLQLAAKEVEDTIALGLEYSTTLFKRTTAQKFAERYVHILNQVVDNRDIKLEDITLFHELAIAKSNVLHTDTADFGF